MHNSQCLPFYHLGHITWHTTTIWGILRCTPPTGSYYVAHHQQLGHITLHTTTIWGVLHNTPSQTGAYYTAHHHQLGHITLHSTTIWGISQHYLRRSTWHTITVHTEIRSHHGKTYVSVFGNRSHTICRAMWVPHIVRDHSTDLHPHSQEYSL